MTRQLIKAFNSNHPEHDKFNEYSPLVPSGTKSVQLDFHAWGKSTNLFCFFTDTASGEKYRLSVFARQSYQPYKGSVSFDQEPIGGLFNITVKENDEDKPSQFVNAEKFEI